MLKRFSGCTVALLAALTIGCVSLPDPVWTGDLDVFGTKYATVMNDAEKCGSHLTVLRSRARNRSWARTITTIIAGTTTATTSFIAATYADEDPDKSTISASIALGAGIVAVLAQAIPDASESLDQHRDASASWSEARRLAFTGGDSEVIFKHLSNCQKNAAPPESLPTKKGAEIQ